MTDLTKKWRRYASPRLLLLPKSGAIRNPPYRFMQNQGRHATNNYSMICSGVGCGACSGGSDDVDDIAAEGPQGFLKQYFSNELLNCLLYGGGDDGVSGGVVDI